MLGVNRQSGCLAASAQVTVAFLVVGAHEQAIALHVDGLRAHALDRLVVQVGQADVDREILQGAQDLHGTQRQHRQLDARVAVLDGLGDQGCHRQPRRYDTQRQAADQRPFGVAQLGDFLLQRCPVVEDCMRPLQHALAFLREAVEALPAFDDRHAQPCLAGGYAPTASAA
jgi:hypothetical protein